MWPFIVAAGVGYVIYKGLFALDEIKVTEASDNHINFLRFNDAISISLEKVSNLRSAHNSIRKKLTGYFSNYFHIPPIQFFIQGSYKMGTMVENMNKFSDVDLGVYFQDKPDIKVSTLQWHIKQALTGHTSRELEVKKMCVRLNYVRDFHIDLPIYYKNDYGKIYFGTKAYGWQKSDPKDFIEWFKEKTRNKPQLIRIIRYLKSWSDYREHQTNKKHPSGLVLTLWAVEYYEKDNRDDVAYTFTCNRILEYLDANYQSDWKANIPVAPYDNTLNRLTENQKEYFYLDFKDMVGEAIEAISSSTNKLAKDKWEDILGYRFN